MMLLQEKWPLGLKRCSNLLYTNFSWPTASNIIQVFFVFMAIIHLSSYRSSRGLTPRHLEVTHEGWDTNFRRFVFILNRLAFLNCSSCLNEGLKKKKKQTLIEGLPCTRHYAKHIKENYLLSSSNLNRKSKLTKGVRLTRSNTGSKRRS